jgi:hypothetical protein
MTTASGSAYHAGKGCIQTVLVRPFVLKGYGTGRRLKVHLMHGAEEPRRIIKRIDTSGSAYHAGKGCIQTVLVTLRAEEAPRREGLLVRPFVLKGCGTVRRLKTHLMHGAEEPRKIFERIDNLQGWRIIRLHRACASSEG